MGSKINSMEYKPFEGMPNTSANNYYYYTNGDSGMTSSGSFTKDRTRWITFDEVDAERLGDNRPYGATKRGVLTNTETGATRKKPSERKLHIDNIGI